MTIMVEKHTNLISKTLVLDLLHRCQVSSLHERVRDFLLSIHWYLLWRSCKKSFGFTSTRVFVMSSALTDRDCDSFVHEKLLGEEGR